MSTSQHTHPPPTRQADHDSDIMLDALSSLTVVRARLLLAKRRIAGGTGDVARAGYDLTEANDQIDRLATLIRRLADHPGRNSG